MMKIIIKFPLDSSYLPEILEGLTDMYKTVEIQKNRDKNCWFIKLTESEDK